MIRHLLLQTRRPRWGGTPRCSLQVQSLSTTPYLKETEPDATTDHEEAGESVVTLVKSEAPDEHWKTFLANSARARWRVSPATKESPADLALRSVIKHTVHPVPKKTASKHMGELAKGNRRMSLKRSRERSKIYGNRQEQISDRAQNAKVKAIAYGPTESLTNLRYRALPNYEIAKRVLKETKTLLERRKIPFQPTRILDFGIGCGSASAAALEIFSENEKDDTTEHKKVEWIHGVDASKTMRDGAEHFLQAFIKESNALKRTEKKEDNADDQDTNQQSEWAPRLTFSAHLSADPNLSPDELSGTMTRGTFDLALCSYTATEIPKHSAILAASALLWEKLRPGGLMVVIEPGTPDGFSNIRAIRQLLLEACPPEGEEDGDEECHVVAPCTHNSYCPLNLYGPFVKGPEGQDVAVKNQAGEPPKEENAELPKQITAAPVADAKGDEIDGNQVIDHVAESRDQAPEDDSDDDDDDEEEDDEDYTGELEKDSDDTFEDNFLEGGEDEDDDYIPPGYIEIPFEWQDNVREYLKMIMPQEPPAIRGYCSFVQTFSGRRGEKFSYLVVEKRITGAPEITESGNSKAHPLDGVSLSDWLAKRIDDQELDLDGENEEARREEFRKEEADLANRLKKAASQKNRPDKKGVKGDNASKFNKEEDDSQGTSQEEEDDMRNDDEIKSNGQIEFPWEMRTKTVEPTAGLDVVRDDVSSYGRLVRAPRKHKNHVLLDCCTEQGVHRHTVTKVLSKKAPGIYQAARKARWGGFWPNSGNVKGKLEE